MPNFWQLLLDILLPRYCVGCKTEGTWLCESCRALIRIPQQTLCPFCETPSPGGRSCFKHATNALRSCLSCGYYHDPILQAALKQFKYSYAEELGKPLATLTAQMTNKFRSALPDHGLVIPIPLAKRKLRERGFNQTLPLANAVASTLNWPIATNILIRKRNTPPQAKLSDEKRRANMIQAFEVIDNGSIRNQSILLVDDVLTTGATLEAAARTLRDAGATQVYGLVLARG